MKYVNNTFISCSNKSVLYLQEHDMNEHFSSMRQLVPYYFANHYMTAIL